jgi:OmpA-OmpF porin, OOP family
MKILINLMLIFSSGARLPLMLFFAASVSLSYAQSSDGIEKDLNNSKMKARANHAIKTGDIYSALFYYEEIVRKDTHDIASRFQLAELYRMARNYKKAEETYADVYRKAKASYITALYYRGLMQKMSGNYKDAKENMIAFRKEAGNVGDADFKALLNKEIAGCDSGMTYRDFPENTVIENIGSSVNHPHAEFSPFLLDSNTMIFGSLRMDTLKYFDIRYDHYEPQPVRQIYKAEKKDGKWIDEGKYDVINDHTMEMGNFVYSPVTDRYYFSKCSKDRLEHVTCKIYYTEKVNGQYTKPVLLPHPVNSEGYTSTQPAIMIDTVAVPVSSKTNKTNGKTVKKSSGKPPVKGGKKMPGKTTAKPGVTKANSIEYLYFVSDRPGGKGGLDLWYTSFNPAKKEWLKPVNFIVNTSQTECTPFYHMPTQTLYFSSNGFTSAGGLDVFKLQKVNGRFTKPQNLSFPVNSPQDELGFMLESDGKKGMLVSNRPGGTPYFHETCCDDIYSFEMYPAKPFICTLDLTVEDTDTAECKKLLLNIRATDLKTKKETLSKVSVTDCKYQLALDKNTKYAFTAFREGFQKDTLTVETRDMSSSAVISKKLRMKPNEKPVVIKPEEGKVFVLKDIQYGSNQDVLSDDAKAVLDSVVLPFMNLHPLDKLIITSHTDDQGSHHYNMGLSNRRAANVVAYLKSKGIKQTQLQGKGLGETQPIVPNQNPDGTDNPIGRGLNRRTEFLLVKPDKK